MNAAIRARTKAEHVGPEAEVRTGEERGFMLASERLVPRSESSFRQCGKSEAEIEDVEGDIDQVDRDTASSPRTQKSIAVEEGSTDK